MNLYNCQGVLWAETEEGRDLGDILDDVRQAHVRRLGSEPNVVLVHPEHPALQDNISAIDGIELWPSRTMQPNWYFAIRLEEMKWNTTQP